MRRPVIAGRVFGAGLDPLSEGIQPVQDVRNLDVAVVRRGRGVLRPSSGSECWQRGQKQGHRQRKDGS